MSIEELLQQLQAQYLASLPAKITQIESQIASRDVDALRESFHKLKGTGRTYGLPEVSDFAEIVEDVCLSHSAQATAAASDALNVLRDIFASRQKQQAFDCTQDRGCRESKSSCRTPPAPAKINSYLEFILCRLPN